MAAEMSRSYSSTGGFSLLELLLVLAMLGVLSVVAVWGNQKMSQKWRLRQGGHQLFEELKTAQAKAEMLGSLTISNGSLVQRRTFVVFEVATGSYAVYNWQDDDGDGISDADEGRLLLRGRLPHGIAYAVGENVDRRACSNVNNLPIDPVTFSSPNYPPCNDEPCIKFDHNGFSVMGPGAIYLSDGQQSLAITATRPGHFTMCQWNGRRWQ